MLGPRRAREGLLLALMAAAAACGTNPRYCDETTACGDPSQVCDLNGICAASEGLTNSCIDPAEICWDAAGPPPPDAALADAPENTPDAPEGTPDAPAPDGFVPFDGFSCTANEFLRCDNSNIVTCGSDGMSEVTNPCTYGCNASAERCNECPPSTVVCNGSTRTTCSANGLITEEFTCPLDCHPTEDRCHDLDPSNNLALYLDQTTTAPVVTLTDGATINTDTGEVINGNSSQVTIPNQLLGAPAMGVPVRVLMVKSITLGSVNVNGSAALAIVADGRIEIRGRFDLSGTSGTAISPGAYPPCGGGYGTYADPHVSGGGGGGFATAGGDGGNSMTHTGGAGGGTGGNVTLTPLRGGCKGGGLTDALFKGESVGGGGGAVQLVSRVEIDLVLGSEAGQIDAAGGGGNWGGNNTVPFRRAGTGAGSGGGILLEAPTITVANGAGMTANGGSGGCSNVFGSNGTLSILPVAGAECNSTTAGDGGAGSAQSSLVPGDGEDINSGSVTTGGGGGGGIGRIRVNTANGTFVPSGGAIITPTASVGTAGRR